MHGLVESASLLLVILNPFALVVYLVDILHEHPLKTIGAMMGRASLISGVVFGIFALGGNRIFTDVLHIQFAAFQVFGGIVFLVIGLKFMVAGGETVTVLRGPPEHLAGAIAMPFMIGPGTVSAAVLAGAHLSYWMALIAIALALVGTVVIILVAKVIFDGVRKRSAALVERYVDILGRVAAVLVGTIAVEMIFDGLGAWLRTSVLR